MTTHRYRYGLLLGGALMAYIPTATTAQAQSTYALEEITVIARKIAENIQDVPMSIQAFDSAVLDNAGIRDFSEISARVPGMQLRLDRALDAEIFIRGIGSDIQSAGADNAIGIFIDNVYMSRNTGIVTDFFDLERVEVLKGPQSLRFGKNVVGGLIHYVTKKPTENYEARAEATYGKYNQVDVSAAVRGPLADNIFAGVTVSSRNRDGFAKNTFFNPGSAGGTDEESRSAQSIRGQLRFVPNDALDILISADYNRRRDGGRWVDISLAGDSDAVTYNRFFAPPIPGLPADFTLPNRNAPFKNADPRRGPKNDTGFEDSDIYGVSANVSWAATDSLDLTSITAYRDAEMEAFEDGCGMFWDFPRDPQTGIPDITSALQGDVFDYLNMVPDCFFNQLKYDNVKQFSQEFRIAGTVNDRLRWSGGAYYLNEKIDRARIVSFLFPDFDTITEFAFANAFGGDVPHPAGGVSNALTDAKNHNLGLFGEITYDITNELTLEAGIRYAYDKKTFTVTRFGDSYDAPIAGGAFTTVDRDSWDAWLPSMTLTYQPDETSTYYARYAKGYKAGGWSGENSGNPEDAIVSYDPELAHNFEVGAKLLMAERRVRLNAAAYFTKYNDLQVQQFVQVDPTRPPDNFIVNASNGTEAYGLELDLQARVTEAISVYGNYAYTKCEFKGELIVDADGTDVDGNTCRRTPKHAFSVGADISYPVSDNLIASAGADFQWSDKYFFDIRNSPDEVIGSQHTLNLRAGVATADDRWDLTFWVKNVTKELNRTSILNLFGTYYTTYFPPRTFGVTLRWRN